MCLTRILKLLYFKIRYKNRIKFYLTTNISKSSTFEGMNRIGRKTLFDGNMGLGSYIADNCVIVANVGRFCSIAENVRTNIYSHPLTYPYVTTSPYFFSTKKQNGFSLCTEDHFEEKRTIKNTDIPISIGNDVWIGEGAFLVGGITIGDGAVVLAHAVVTKDVPPYAIVGGVPAKVVKYRFDTEDIDFLCTIKWWDKGEDWINSHLECMLNFDKLRGNYNGE